MSAPYNTSPPQLTLQADGSLRADDGGWDCDSGPVVLYEFKFTIGDLVWSDLVYPLNPTANVVVHPPDGRWAVSVRAGTISTYPPPTGTVTEWSAYATAPRAVVVGGGVTPLEELRAGVTQLKGSLAYQLGWVNVRRGTDKCADALLRLGG